MTGNRLGNYELQQLLGEGGMGSVYRALDIRLQRVVALKVLIPEIAAKQEFRQRFLQEARAAAALDHPNIVRIFAFDVDEEGRYYLVMEYVPGGSLRGFTEGLQSQNKLMDITEALRLLQQVAAALDYAHTQGMVHRDVKPDNILLKPASSFGTASYNALLTDFGLAKLLDRENLVQTGISKPMGTLPYMAPEQFTGNIDYRVDIYALGIVMYELLVGTLPFIPRSLADAGELHTKQPPPPPRQLRPDLSPQLEAVLLKTLEKAKERRYQTGMELASAIQDVLQGGKGGQKMTRMQDSDPAIDKQEMPPTPPPAPVNTTGQDRIIIQREGYAPQALIITKETLMIGRDPRHDIALASEKVSRTHARIDRQPDGSYTIMDLGSTNGTYLEGTRLPAQSPYVYAPGYSLVMGEYHLTLQAANS